MIIDTSALLAVVLTERDEPKFLSARLNLGDCFVYSLAKIRHEPLMFKGEDFAQTDIEPALKG